MIPFQTSLAIIGLGYVGLPLAVEFGKRYPTVGFDTSRARIDELRAGNDHTLEVTSEELRDAVRLRFTDSVDELSACNIFIVAVPTPVDAAKRPDLTILVAATRTVGSVIKSGDTVIYESTVYPGATEEVCVPVLEQTSGLRFNVDFFCGYSPERINPGDREHRLTNICKITAGSTPATADLVDDLYASIVRAGTHRAPSIRTAEAAKVIENTQRDLNIALVNELAVIFDRLGIDTQDVLAAAGTKWNFLPFTPGLVGGHCIGVDPYYLTHKAQEIGHHPEVILAGRRINDRMGAHVALRVVRLMSRQRNSLVESRALILGLTFKEDCPDLRNTRVIDVVDELRTFNVHVDVYDPWANASEAKREYGLDLLTEPSAGIYDTVVLAVAHRQFIQRGAHWIRSLCKPDGVVFDVKSVLPRAAVDGRL